jgi:hypothetical protein
MPASATIMPAAATVIPAKAGIQSSFRRKVVIRVRLHLMLAVLAFSACEPADDVHVQPLPALEQPSPEARAGLPEVAGAWRFAGWELAPADSVNLAGGVPGFGQILIEKQRLDSIAGFYAIGQSRIPLVGEVRRDSVIAMAALTGAGQGRYLTGRVEADTFWLALTSLMDPGSWPDNARAAFVRAPVASTFVRLEGAIPVLAAADSARVDSFPLASQAPRRADGHPMPGRRPPFAGLPSQAPRQAPQQRAPQQAPQQAPAEPPLAEPEPETEFEPEPEPEVEPEPAERRRTPRLLGEPVRRDSIG